MEEGEGRESRTSGQSPRALSRPIPKGEKRSTAEEEGEPGWEKVLPLGSERRTQQKRNGGTEISELRRGGLHST